MLKICYHLNANVAFFQSYKRLTSLNDIKKPKIVFIYLTGIIFVLNCFGTEVIPLTKSFSGGLVGSRAWNSNFLKSPI